MFIIGRLLENVSIVPGRIFRCCIFYIRRSIAELLSGISVVVIKVVVGGGRCYDESFLH
jgi:hypothetical protein